MSEITGLQQILSSLARAGLKTLVNSVIPLLVYALFTGSKQLKASNTGFCQLGCIQSSYNHLTAISA